MPELLCPQIEWLGHTVSGVSVYIGAQSLALAVISRPVFTNVISLDFRLRTKIDFK